MIELSRSYIAPINISAAFTAQIDIFEILAASGKPCILLGFELGQPTEVGDAQEEMLTLILKRATGTVTSGSGGGTPTFQSVRPNDTAAGVTAETGNTTKLVVGTGTITELARFQWNVRQSMLYLPVPEERIIFDASTRLVLELATTPADSIGGITGRMMVGEII